ncbi:MAG: hypothetical protein NTX72_05525 [Candidatus Uhrbacteria bacterium]|nr:hypothetical protein [Candidatus Uhrbacteria bacterium]
MSLPLFLLLELLGGVFIWLSIVSVFKLYFFLEEHISPAWIRMTESHAWRSVFARSTRMNHLRIIGVQAMSVRSAVKIRPKGFFTKNLYGFMVGYRSTNTAEWFDLAPQQLGTEPRESIQLKDIRRIELLRD